MPLPNATFCTNDSHVHRDKLRQTLIKRDINIDFSGCVFKNWLKSSMIASHFFNALSLFFPSGEKFFVHSVRNYKNRLTDDRMIEAVSGFFAQEATHSREHRQYVSAMKLQGYDVEKFDTRMFSAPLEKISPIRRLAMTVAMEHFTASLSHSLIRSGFVTGDIPLCQMWHWHALEELEHKSVAFNVFRHVCGRGSAAYFIRTINSLFTTMNFLSRLTLNHIKLIQIDSHYSLLRCCLLSLWFAWGSPGILRMLIPDFFRYFNPAFHPDNRDDTPLLEQWKHNPLLEPLLARDRDHHRINHVSP